MIEAKALTKYYGSTAALTDVSFQVGEGETVGFLGPNGAGKSTTMRILTGFLTATSGSASVDGFDVARESLEARRRIGYLPESTPLYRDMRVREFLEYRARLKGLDRAERRRDLAEALDRCKLLDVKNRLIGQLSKGYRQRVGLADTMLGRPPLLILDEPTVGLDPNQVVETRSLVQDLGADRTVFLSTHILHEVELACSRVIIISGGKVIADGETASVCEQYTDHRVLRMALFADEDPVPELTPLRGVRNVNLLGRTLEGAWSLRVECSKGVDPRKAIASLATAQGWLLQELRLEPVRLEDIFARLTVGGSDDEKQTEDPR